jgi:hypothetical protein
MPPPTRGLAAGHLATAWTGARTATGSKAIRQDLTVRTAITVHLTLREHYGMAEVPLQWQYLLAAHGCTAHLNQNLRFAPFI